METLRLNSEIAIFSKFEEEGLTIFKQYIEEYLRAEKLNRDSCTEATLYLEKIKCDNETLLKYLHGRKNQPDVAWDTLRRYVENRFILYPEVFTQEVPQKLKELIRTNVLGVFKKRDKFGRRVIYFDMAKWDPDTYTLDDLTVAGVLGAELFWKDPEVMKNGIVVVENTSGFGMAHARQHTMTKMMRMRNIFVYSFPVAIKGIFYLRMPYVFSLVFKMSKHLFPKKIKERMFLSSGNEIPSDLFDLISPEHLPPWAGGTLPIDEASEDMSFYEF